MQHALVSRMIKILTSESPVGGLVQPMGALLSLLLVCTSTRVLHGAELTLGEFVSDRVTASTPVLEFQFTAPVAQRVYVDAISAERPTSLGWRLLDSYDRELVANSTRFADLGAVDLAGGEYTLRVAATRGTTGSGSDFTFRVHAATTTETNAAIDTSIEGSLDAPGDRRQYRFDAAADSLLFFDLLSVDSARAASLRIEESDGRLVQATTRGLRDVGPIALTGGSYLLTIESAGDETTGYVFRLRSPSLLNAALTLDTAVASSIDRPGDARVWTFSAPPSTRVFLDVLSAQSPNELGWSLQESGGRELLTLTSSLSDQGPFGLVGGDYELRVDGEDDALGEFEFRVVTVVDEVFDLELDQTQSGDLDGPGETHWHRFNAPPGLIVFLDFLSSDNPERLDWALEDAFGRAVLPLSAELRDRSPVALVGGDYSVRITGEAGALGTYAFRVSSQGMSDFLPQGTLIAVGAQVSDQLAPDGTARYTFNAFEGDEVFLDALSNAADLTWSLIDPVGETIQTLAWRSAIDSGIGPLRLAAGLYTIELVASRGAMPSFEFRLLDADNRSHGAALGDRISGDFAMRPGSIDSVAFDALGGETLYLSPTTGGSSLRWSLFDPAGEAVFENAVASTHRGCGPFVLRSGEYRLVLDPEGSETPAWEVLLSSAARRSSLLELDRVESGSFVGRVGSIDEWRLDLPETTEVYADLIEGGAGSRWSLFDAAGVPVFQDHVAISSTAADQGPFTLRAGSYRWVFDPTTNSTPTYSFAVRRVERRARPLELGVVQSATLPSPGGSVTFAFTATEGQRLFFDLVLTDPDLRWTLFDPVRQPVFENRIAFPTTADLGPFRLAAGDYRLTLSATSGDTPDFQFLVEDRAQDLVVETIVLSPSSLAIDSESQDIEIEWSVRNQGGGAPIDGDWVDAVYLSTDAEFGDDNDVFVGSVPHAGPLQSNEVYSASLSVPITAGAAGTFFAFVRCDDENDIGEARGEENNTASRPFSVLPTPPESSGLVIFDHEDGTRFPVGSVVALSGRANAVGGSVAVLYIVDVSASTRRSGFDADFSGVLDAADDVDGDGRPGTILDAELQAVVRLDEILRETASVRHAVIGFSAESFAADLSPLRNSQVFWLPADEDRDQNGTSDFAEAVRSFSHTGLTGARQFTEIAIDAVGTDFNAPIALADELLPAAGDIDQRIVIFLTDGEGSTLEFETIRSLANRDVNFKAFQINDRDVTPRLSDLVETIDQSGNSHATAHSVDDAGDLLLEIVNSFSLVAVQIDGETVDRVDASGRFFHLVRIEDVGVNEFEIEVFDASGSSFTSSLRLLGYNTEAAPFGQLIDVSSSVEVEYGRTSWNRALDSLTYRATACNRGAEALDSPLLMVIESFAHPSVSALQPDGVTPEGKPFFLFLDPAAQPTLAAGECAVPRSLTFHTPEGRRVEFEASWHALGNSAPGFVSVPTTEALTMHTYSYDVQADDADGHELEYSLVIGPRDLRIDATTGEIRWLPGLLDVGTHSVRIAVSDGRGGRAEQTWAVTVRSDRGNSPPNFTSRPPTRVAAGAPLRYLALATDPDGDALLFSKRAGPASLVVTPDGLVEWPFAHPGVHTITIAAADPQGGGASQTWRLTVGAVPTDASAPQLVGSPPLRAVIGSQWFYQPLAYDADPEDQLLFELPESPEGMSIDAATGRILWTPTAEQAGHQHVTLRVSDASGASATQTWDIDVRELRVDRAPVIDSEPPLPAYLDIPWEYPAHAVDADADAISWELSVAPEGLTIDADTGFVEWTPPEVGRYLVGIRAVSGSGGFGSQFFEVVVVPANSDPEITSDPDLNARVGATWRYDVEASDIDQNKLRYLLTSAPEGLSIDSLSGLATWVPDAVQAGTWTVAVLVEDGLGGSDLQTFNLTVAPDTTPPELVITLSKNPVPVTEPVRVCVQATDDGSVVERRLSLGRRSILLDALGCAVLTLTETGTQTLLATAVDSAGNRGLARASLRVVSDKPGDAPIVSLIAPEPLDVLTLPARVVANITDDRPELLAWTVQLAEKDSDEFQTIGSGTGAVTLDVVGEIDTTLLANGVYRVQVLADDGVQSSGVEIEISVAGEMKLGSFSLEQVDARVPIAGIPLTVTRQYDSLEASRGRKAQLDRGEPVDFGRGWRLATRGRVFDSALESRTGKALVDRLANESFRRGSRVYVTRPDGRTVGFTFEPRSAGFPVPLLAVPVLEPDASVRDRLEVLEPAGLVFLVGGVASQVGIPYNPTKYRLTTREGVVYDIDETKGVEQITDASGNVIEVREEGLFSSTGVAIEFERDEKGRIRRVLLPDEAALTYAYDKVGNLASFTDARGNQTEYLYEALGHPHHLTEIIDPLERSILRNVYDEDGRQIARCGIDGDPDTLEGCTLFEHHPDEHRSTVFDERSAQTDLVYDGIGNLSIERHWLNESKYEQRTDVYDTDAHLVSRTIIKGPSDPFPTETQTFTWIDGHLVSTRDVLGRETTWEYDACNGPSRFCAPTGDCESWTRDASCRLASAIDSNGNAVHYEYTETGRLASITDGEGTRFQIDYDERGYPLRLLSPGAVAATYVVEDSGELVEFTDRTGLTSTYDRDEFGRPLSEDWDDGTSISYDFDASGRIESISSPDCLLEYSYWPNGRLLSETCRPTNGDPATTLQYGHEVGGELLPGYDANGNLTHVTDGFGGLTEYRYDTLNRLGSIRQSGPGVAEKRVEIDWSYGDRRAAIRRYDVLEGGEPLIETELFQSCLSCSDGLMGLEHRDAAGEIIDSLDLNRDNLGRILQIIDGDGIHGYSYDGAGRLTAVRHPRGNPLPDESYTYDRAGNRVTSHLSAAHIMGYSEQGSGGGNQLFEDERFTYTYDEAGSLTRRIDLDTGQVVTLEYDHRRRVTRIVERDAAEAITHEVRMVYDALDRRIRSEFDGRVRRYVYDGQNPILVLDGDGAVIARRLYSRSIDEVFAEERGGINHWLLTDQVGTVRALVDAAGKVERIYRDSFGRRIDSGNSASELGYTSREELPIAGWYYHRTRVYDPGTGRFLQEDVRPPFGYTYARNNPLSFRGPLGRLPLVEYARLSNSSRLWSDRGNESCLPAPQGFVYQVSGVAPPCILKSVVPLFETSMGIDADLESELNR